MSANMIAKAENLAQESAAAGVNTNGEKDSVIESAAEIPPTVKSDSSPTPDDQVDSEPNLRIDDNREPLSAGVTAPVVMEQSKLIAPSSGLQMIFTGE